MDYRRSEKNHYKASCATDSIHFLFQKFANRALRSHLYTARNKKSKPLGNTLKELHA